MRIEATPSASAGENSGDIETPSATRARRAREETNGSGCERTPPTSARDNCGDIETPSATRARKAREETKGSGCERTPSASAGYNSGDRDTPSAMHAKIAYRESDRSGCGISLGTNYRAADSSVHLASVRICFSEAFIRFSPMGCGWVGVETRLAPDGQTPA